jgi:hypothetical protein
VGLAGVSAVISAGSGSDSIRLFTASPTAGTVTALDTDQESGGLTQRGCVSAAPRDGCTVARALAGASDVAVAARSGLIFVAARDADAVVALRQTPTGLEQVSGAQGCAAVAVGGCAPAKAMDEPIAVAVDEIHDRVYVAARGSDAVAVFTTGLQQVGCVQQGDGSADGCSPGRALDAPEGVAVAGDTAIVASSGANGVALLRGTDETACLTEGGTQGCTAGEHLLGASRVAAFGTSAYVAAPGSGALSTLRVSGGAASQMATAAAPTAALALPPAPFAQIADAPSYAGSHVYAGGAGLLTFSRDYFSGALAPPLPTPAFDPGGDVAGIAVSANQFSLSAYAAVPSAGAIVAFARNLPPDCGYGYPGPPGPPKVGPGPTPVQVPCYDLNGDPLTYSVASAPALGRILRFDGRAAIYQGPKVNRAKRTDTFSVRGSDGGDSGTAFMSVRLDYVTDAEGTVLGPPSVRILDRRVRLDRRGRIRLRVRCTTKTGSRCRARFVVRRGKAITRTSAKLRSGATARVRIHLGRRLRRQVRHARTGVLLKVTVTARDSGGRKGSATRRIRVRAAR